MRLAEIEKRVGQLHRIARTFHQLLLTVVVMVLMLEEIYRKVEPLLG